MEQPNQGVGSDRAVIVGVNGTVESGAALRWAASRAAQFAPVTPATIWAYPPWAVGRPPKGAPVANPEAGFIRRSKRQVADVLKRDLAQDLPEHVVREGPAGPTLVELAERASLLVIGARNRRAPTSTFGRSVTRHCIARCRCPVALVPVHGSRPDAAGRVVVGVDGSAESLAALGWAIRAVPQDETIQAIQVIEADRADSGGADVAEKAMEELQNLVDRAAMEAGASSSTNVVPVVENGEPAEVLREHAERAELLAVGARGRGALAHALVGSVTTSLADHPTTVTVVVPALRPSGE